ncbi:MFS transporter [Roseococcus sp. SDR]|uniref:MFS transporter n=1 Tax=Roseococcus sp. SDR TaxID=2835532 RepID=UPI001BCAA1E4|nr:MFS transporter [Roseococcus sp. SDR]MBS7790805.1 MFS transporter [Roseococcus sp. SDR]MBV1846119.1 MFS transporter [Roseococcus sp. SDR]
MARPDTATLARLLRTPDYRRLWMLGGIANAMRWLELLAATLWTFEMTGSALAVSVVAMVRALPMMLLGAVAGALAERMDRRRLLIALQTSSALGAGGVALLALLGQLATWHLMLQGLLAGLAWAGEMATRRRMAADAAPQGDLVQAVALDTLTGSTTRAVGPLLGGVIYQFAGIAVAAAIACALHLVALRLATQVTAPPRRPATGNPFAGIGEAVRLVLSLSALRIVLGVTFVMNVFAFSYNSILPAFGTLAFGASSAAIGLLAAAEPFGALLGGLWLALGRRNPPGAAPLVVGSFLFMILLVVVAFTGSYALAWLLLAIGGLGTARFAAMQTSVVMTAAPPEIRSRVLGLVTTCIGMGPLGVLAMGVLGDSVGPRLAIAIMSGVGLALMILLLLNEARRRQG